MIIKEFKSKKNRVALYFGKGRFGLQLGFQLYERFDWNHFIGGFTFFMVVWNTRNQMESC